MFDVVEEYKKNPALSEDDVQHIKDWMMKQPHLPSITDQQIILFLHSCYYKIEATKTTINNFFTIRTDAPEIFSNRNPLSKSIQNALDTMYMVKLPGKTADGYDIFLSKLNLTDPQYFSTADIIKIYNMQGDLCYYKDCGTSPGVIYIIDMESISLGHMFKLNLNVIKKHLSYLQDALPVRLKGIHLLNVVSFIDMLMNLIKPFMNSELFNLFHYHQANSEDIFQFVPKHMLPKECGGTTYTLTELQNQTRKMFEECEEWLKNEEFLRIDKSKLRVKSKPVQNETELSGSFKKLSFD